MPVSIIPEADLYIFDLDGTILDSMPEWEHLGRNYLSASGITSPDNLEKTIETMTLEESAAYFQTLGLAKTADEIIAGVTDFIRDKYRFSIPAKPDMKKLIRDLHQNGKTLCLLTTSEEDCARSAMKRLHLLSCFQYFYTSSMLGLGKNSPSIYQKTCALCHTAPANTIVLEDAAYAVRSAVQAGCTTIAVADSSNEKDWHEIEKLTKHFWCEQHYLFQS